MNSEILADMEDKELITIYHYIVHWTGRILYGKDDKRVSFNTGNGHAVFFSTK